MTDVSVLREATVLLVLDGLEQRCMTPIREYELQQLIRVAQPADTQLFEFFDRPISYSYDLQGYLKQLEQGHYLDEHILVRNGWVPRFEYALNWLGKAQALDLRARLQIETPPFLANIDRQLDLFQESYSPSAPINPH